MSYIITSNIDVNNYGKTPNSVVQGINKPYSYTNSMDNIIIPEDSEIALQSIKVNREGGISLSQQNNVYALYFGKMFQPDFNTTFDEVGFMADSIEQPIPGNITNLLGESSGEFFPEDLASALQANFRLTDFHPNTQISDINASGWTVNASYLGNVGFKGYEFSHFQFPSASNVNKANALSDGLVPNAAFPNRNPLTTAVNGTALEVSNTLEETNVENICPTICTNIPLSLNGGVFNCSLANAINGCNTTAVFEKYFEIGLSRGQRNFKIAGDALTAGDYQAPPYYRSNLANGVGYYDWVVKNVANNGTDFELRIFHSVLSAGGGGFRLQEVEYQSGLTANAKFRFNASAYGVDGKVITNIEFRAKGEIMDIAFINGSGVEVVISSNTYSGTNGSDAYASTTKGHILKPISQTCWTLYPKLWVPGKKVGHGSVNKIGIMTYNGVIPKGAKGSYVYGGAFESTSRPDYISYSPDEIYDNQTDFYSSCQNGTYPFHLCAQIDLNSIGNDFSDTTEAITITYNGQKTVSGETYIDLNNVLVLGESEIFRLPTDVQPNTKQILGYENDSVVRDTDAGTTISVVTKKLKTVFTSLTTPKMISGQSTFVRVRNLTHTTSNVANRSNSKILYHIPKFDNSGTEVGNLFFEPNERTYVKLNNTTKLNINTFDVDLVDAREMLQSSYTGTTVACFHIRKTPK